ncbi:MAG: uL15 family ribosomal protein, partial [Sinobacteraceae bacterium]|nr:uL15 family ribosomal protein [Nevskiaceae bacterium]
LPGETVDLATLLEAGLILLGIDQVKIILSGEVTRAFTIGAGVQPTRGARAAIEKAGGKIASAPAASAGKGKQDK